MEIFIPWSSVQPYFPFHVSPEYVPHIYGIVFTLFATFYSVIGGMHSIVIGDLIKYIILTVACIAVGHYCHHHAYTGIRYMYLTDGIIHFSANSWDWTGQQSLPMQIKKFLKTDLVPSDSFS